MFNWQKLACGRLGRPDPLQRGQRRTTLVTGLALSAVLACSGFPDQQANAQQSDADLAAIAQKTQNPVGDAWALISQNDTFLLGGDLVDGVKISNNFKFQPLMSLPLFEDRWNLVIRPVLQLNSSPFDSDAGSLPGSASSPFGRTNGLGDTILLTLLAPASDDGWVIGGGVTQILPTATDDILGQGKYQAGPAAVIARLGNKSGGFGIDHFNMGILPQQWWSYAGDGDRDHTNQMDLQYFLNWRATPTRLIGMTPNISINWNADGGFNEKVAIPIGLGFIDIFKLGKLPVRWGMEAQYYLTGPDSIKRSANFRFFVAPIIANPFKK